MELVYYNREATTKKIPRDIAQNPIDKLKRNTPNYRNKNAGKENPRKKNQRRYSE